MSNRKLQAINLLNNTWGPTIKKRVVLRKLQKKNKKKKVFKLNKLLNLMSNWLYKKILFFNKNV